MQLHGISLRSAPEQPVWSLKECANDDRPRQFRLADAPMPAYELLDVSKYNRLTVQTSRGCPQRCECCAGSILVTDQYKQKPIYKVLEEIDEIRRIWDHRFIEFADDNSFVNRP